jgi:hypothetical protein
LLFLPAIAGIMLLTALSLQAQDDKPAVTSQTSPAVKNKSAQRPVKAGRDSVLRAYSINDLLDYKDFYERERFRLEGERVFLRDKGIQDMENFLTSHRKSKILDKVIIRLAELH